MRADTEALDGYHGFTLGVFAIDGRAVASVCKFFKIYMCLVIMSTALVEWADHEYLLLRGDIGYDITFVFARRLLKQRIRI